MTAPMKAASRMQRAEGRPRVLWIGRMLFSTQVRVRETELARYFTRHANLFALDRSDALPRAELGFVGKVRMRAKLWNAATRVLEEGELTRFTTRIAGATGPILNRLAAAFNGRKMERALARFACTHIFLSSPFFFMPPPRVRRHYHVHFDLVDNFHDEWPENFVGRSRRAFLREAMSNADTLSACSHSLCDRVRELTGREPAYAPNGAPVDRFARFSQADGLALRGKLGLDGKFVIGFIGNHGADFDGMATLLDAFVMAREARADLALLIVGPDSDKLAKARGIGRDQGVWIIGPVAPDDVPPYFLACYAGVHPYDMRPLTHDATPLNVIEFSACAKPVLCNPLREMQRLALPNVRFTRDGSARGWTEAFLDPASFAPFDSDALARAIEPFQWSHSADVIRAEMGL